MKIAKLTDAVKEVSDKLKYHVQHMSAEQRKVLRRRKAKLNKQLRTKQQQFKAAIQNSPQLTLKV